jgi:hypothetical protein
MPRSLFTPLTNSKTRQVVFYRNLKNENDERDAALFFHTIDQLKDKAGRNLIAIPRRRGLPRSLFIPLTNSKTRLLNLFSSVTEPEPQGAASFGRLRLRQWYLSWLGI